MKTGLDVVDILRAYLATSALMSDANKPNGGLYKYQRPLNSAKEDVVVNSLAQGRGQISEGVLNVNIYVPNLTHPVVAKGDNTQPNVPRLKYLTNLASIALDEVYGEDYNFRVQQDNLFPDANNQHYVNLRIEITSINI